MKNKKRGLILFCVIFSLSLVSAISVEIDMKESFGIGEEIYFDYTITSGTSQEIEYMPNVNCPNAPLALLDIKTANLEANVAFTEKYVYMSSVGEEIEPQTCNATVGILNPETLEQKSFSIVTNPSFEFEVLTCKDVGCVEKTKTFILNENIYFDYSSDVEDVSVTGELIYPNGEREQLVFPTSVKAEKVGSYELEIVVLKQGYKTITKTVQFGVIVRAANIGYTSLAGEKDKIEMGKYMLFVLIGIVLVLAVVVFIKFFGRLKRRWRRRKLGVGRELKKGLQKKERIIKKKERVLFKKLFRRKKKLPQGKKQEVDKKMRKEKKVLTREKIGVKKEFVKKLGKEKKEVQKSEKRIGAQEKKNEIRRLLAKGRGQLAKGNRLGAGNSYRKIKRLHRSLKEGEKNRELYNQLLTFHGRLKKKK